MCLTFALTQFCFALFYYRMGFVVEKEKMIWSGTSPIVLVPSDSREALQGNWVQGLQVRSGRREGTCGYAK